MAEHVDNDGCCGSGFLVDYGIMHWHCDGGNTKKLPLFEVCVPYLHIRIWLSWPWPLIGACIGACVCLCVCVWCVNCLCRSVDDGKKSSIGSILFNTLARNIRSLQTHLCLMHCNFCFFCCCCLFRFGGGVKTTALCDPARLTWYCECVCVFCRVSVVGWLVRSASDYGSAGWLSSLDENAVLYLSYRIVLCVYYNTLYRSTATLYIVIN